MDQDAVMSTTSYRGYDGFVSTSAGVSHYDSVNSNVEVFIERRGNDDSWRVLTVELKEGAV